MKKHTKWERKDEESCFWVENWPKKPVWSPEKGNYLAFHDLTVLTERGLGVFGLLKTCLTLPSVFHHNRNSPQSLSLAVWITRMTSGLRLQPEEYLTTSGTLFLFVRSRVVTQQLCLKQ